MGLIKKLKRSVWEIFVDKYFTPAIIISQDIRDISFPPSQEFNSNFTHEEVELFDNGSDFSICRVTYNVGGTKSKTIYKTTTTFYPVLGKDDSVEEYKSSFLLND